MKVINPRGKVLKKITFILPKNHKKITENRKKKSQKNQKITKNHEKIKKSHKIYEKIKKITEKSRKNQKISYTFFGVLYPSNKPTSISSEETSNVI